MSEFDLEHLIGGFATNTLTESEHQALFRAAMVNQRLFDLLADEQALKELLDDPAVRRRLLQQLKDPQSSVHVGWFDQAVRWATRWDTLAVSGSLAVLALATFFGLNLYRESQQIVREEAAKPGLSDVLREPTVRAKLNAKAPTELSPQDPRAGQAPADAEQRPQSVEAKEATDTSLTKSPRRQSAPDEAGTQVAQATRAGSTSTGPPAQSPQSAQAHADDRAVSAAPAAAPAPPVVLPRVPPSLQKKRRADNKAASVRSEESGLPKDSSVQSPAVAQQEPPQTGQPAQSDMDKGVADDRLPEPSPAVGNARTLFYAEATSPKLAAPKPEQGPSTPTQGSSTMEAAQSTADAAAPPSSQTGMDRTDQIETTVSETPTDGSRSNDSPPPPPPQPLAIRYYQRPLPLQGAAARAEGLALRELTLQVNQPGFVYVITRDAHRGWTVLEPARTAATTGLATAEARRTYRVLMTSASTPLPDHRTYLVFSRQPEAALEQALALMGGTRTEAEVAQELEQLLRPLLATYPTQSLTAEQATEPTSGRKTGTFTYVAGAGERPQDRLIYRIPPIP